MVWVIKSSSENTFTSIISSYFQLGNAFAQFVKNEYNEDIADKFGLDVSRCYELLRALGEEKLEQLITNFYNHLPDDAARKKLIYGAVNVYNFPVNEETILVDEKGNPHDMYEDSFLKSKRREVSRISDDEIEMRIGDSYMRVRFDLDERTGYREKRMVAMGIAPQEYEITPVVTWKKDKKTGKREYFCGKVTDELIQAFPEVFSQRHDTLLGQIVVAGYSDELKQILPTSLPLVKGGRKQNMLEAQMPVFVPLFARAYLNRSPVIAGFEGLGPMVRKK
ncbi:MAG: hypothetical protein A3D74_00195 [Candidatus Levybacteria bacterium RIFCSPHIGHO2_02_FULL_37_13]|nr:MAG: hypothetical protein A3D74_00195 [Candidatus Levybacteria bacterium RIFCSPHIGHO2_02_FULL_37_13]OGH29733.1 MAG: hypothetical protein A3E40_02900 [Candidatus Levybacteria bacterium RIFCSPHIGHO2_12_FULL_37_9]OGH39402.1 MAG: hypothetical protein A3B41_01380 [Candidatus Levybacteria bacterium RIFCSPLOWO2_01_FULL_37_26]